ncbi:MAG: hypothetical protein K0U29_01850 [Gammaproteobacteria bacterium]|nr:hypothetical protein [Gammaproteobacteria bacterium]MCH9743653.1 hypothetical protein [Gammaproteobacteria bacterium]
MHAGLFKNSPLDELLESYFDIYIKPTIKKASEPLDSAQRANFINFLNQAGSKTRDVFKAHLITMEITDTQLQLSLLYFHKLVTKGDLKSSIDPLKFVLADKTNPSKAEAKEIIAAKIRTLFAETFKPTPKYKPYRTTCVI